MGPTDCELVCRERSAISNESFDIARSPLVVQRVDLPREDVCVIQGITYFVITYIQGDTVVPFRRRIRKRYREFRELACYLEFSDAFPRKHLFSCIGDKLEKRRLKLESWLRMALWHQNDFPDMRQLLREFLGYGSQFVEKSLVPDADSLTPHAPRIQAPRQEHLACPDDTLQVQIPPGMQA